MNVMNSCSPVLQVAKVLQVEFSGVLRQIYGVHILERKRKGINASMRRSNVAKKDED